MAAVAVGDYVMAKPKVGPGTAKVPAVIVALLPDRHEKDFSDGSIRTYARVRVRYDDGDEADWDEIQVDET
jgi:hypothetical protein